MHQKLIPVLFGLVLSCRTTPPSASSDVKGEGLGTTSVYVEKIQPLFDSRCVACHACSQSPCQLNLTSYDGVRRGALALDAYAKRLTKVDPVRLNIDASTEAGWRAKGFWPVVGDGPNSILWEMLQLKSEFPAEKITLATEDALLASGMCQSLAADHSGDIQSFRKYYRDPAFLTGKTKRAYGMPYGFPALSTAELADVRSWLDGGAQGPNAAETLAGATPKSDDTAAQIKQWEDFLNGPSLKERLVARYIYEHLFLAHVYFGDDQGHFRAGAENEFYRLVRTTQATGPVTEESAARHPYDDAGLSGAVMYRFRKLNETVVHKSHIPYQLSDRKMSRLKELFFDASWTPTQFPPYGPPGANPFRTFIEVPAWARYQFLLDDAEFFTRNDIRGPVCTGNLAINVIQDLGWRMYLKPTSDPSVTNPDYFTATDASGRQVADLLDMPAESQATTIASAAAALQSNFLGDEKAYQALKDKAYAASKPKIGIDDIWDGNGNAQHSLQFGEDAYGGALQSIYRNYDNSDVTTGLLGNLPKTAEIMDYPVMERTYYDLVAGFDVYGSTVDGYNIRAYKDTLRLEAEDQFLKLAPYQRRRSIRDYWYDDSPLPARLALRAWMDLWYPLYPEPSADRDSLDAYPELAQDATGQDVSETVMRRVAAHFRAQGLGRPDYINCPECGPQKIPPAGDTDVMSQFVAMTKAGAFPQYLPEVAFLRIGTGADDDLAYTILANRFRLNTKFLLDEEYTNVPSRDKLMVIDDLVGSFPNLYIQMTRDQVGAFIQELTQVTGPSAYQVFRKKWAVARNDATIWDLTDWMYRHEVRKYPVQAGRFDLARYEIFYK